mmetsp:Transcript_9311/g.12669  ORF Transcript_9311/g.12669 Transcript_9311/m.12669 type:complete len:106 (+) Transcript_9311:2259-2576(+)
MYKRIIETELLISRYQTTCLQATDYFMSQYETDLSQIKMLATQKKQAFKALPYHERNRLDLGLTKQAYKLYLKRRAGTILNEEDERSGLDSESFINPAHLYSFVH